VPLARLAPELRELAEALLLDEPASAGGDPLATYLRRFERPAAGAARAASTAPALPLDQELRRRIVEAEPGELAVLLGAALTRMPARRILEEILLPAMDEVGRLFGAGALQLPFVLQSAEAMRAAVSFLEPLLGASATSRGTLVLGTVSGDVHDIGKNLVDIILSNNGYRVRNLGIRVSIDEMIRVWQEERADAIGMSGLLVKSTQVMKENLLELRRRGLSPTVLLGGAALSRRFVEEELQPVYGPVFYCRDGFEALRVLASPEAGDLRRRERGDLIAHATIELSALSSAFSASSAVKSLELPLEAVLDRLDEHRLFRARWHYRSGSFDEHARPALASWKKRALAEALLRPRAVYGHLEGSEWPAAFIVTVGEEPSRRAAELFAAHRYRDLLHLHGLAVEATEVAADLVHARILDELGLPPAAPGTGRVSFGYPSCPDLEGQRALVALLGAERIGVTLTETLQLVPEQSVSALVLRSSTAGV
jgi:5-methyltetrahydrofolate--homocysteine methyltransferase